MLSTPIFVLLSSGFGRFLVLMNNRACFHVIIFFAEYGKGAYPLRRIFEKVKLVSYSYFTTVVVVLMFVLFLFSSGCARFLIAIASSSIIK